MREPDYRALRPFLSRAKIQLYALLILLKIQKAQGLYGSWHNGFILLTQYVSAMSSDNEESPANAITHALKRFSGTLTAAKPSEEKEVEDLQELLRTFRSVEPAEHRLRPDLPEVLEQNLRGSRQRRPQAD